MAQLGHESVPVLDAGVAGGDAKVLATKYIFKTFLRGSAGAVVGDVISEQVNALR